MGSMAIRNDQYKVVTNFTQAYDPTATNGCMATTTDEFYKIDEAVPTPRLDREHEEPVAARDAHAGAEEELRGAEEANDGVT